MPPPCGSRRRATCINQVWSYDFLFDQTEDGRRLKWLPICDEFSRESVALEVARTMEAKDVISVLEQAVAQRGAPEFIRSGQRAGVHRGGAAGMDKRERFCDPLHRSGQPVGKSLQRELQQPLS